MDESKPGKESAKTPGQIKREKNLIPARPGEPNRNPTGKNQYTWLRDSGIKVLEEMLEQGGHKKESLQLMLEKLRYEFLVKGNVAAGKELFDRVFGKAHQSVDVTTNGKEINNTTVNVIDLKASELANRLISGETKQNDTEHDQNISG